MNRLTLLQINIIGICIAVVLALVLGFVWVKPKFDQASSTEAQAVSVQGTGGTPDKVAAHQNDLAKAQKQAVQTQAGWEVNAARYMPPGSLFNPKATVIGNYEWQPIGPLKGVKDIPTLWGRWITAWYDAQKKDGITVAPGTIFAIPAYSTNPNNISQLTYLAFPEPGHPWPVTVYCKNFLDAIDHLKKFNDMQHHGVPVVNDVSLQGHSPDLALSYTLALYVIPSTPPPAEDTRLGTGAIGGVGGKAGFMGSMMGGPGKGAMMPGLGGLGPGKGGGPTASGAAAPAGGASTSAE